MLDWSEDVTGAPIVKVLLRIMGMDVASTSTLFLTIVYTIYGTCDSPYDVRLVEEVTNYFVGFSAVAGVVTDNGVRKES